MKRANRSRTYDPIQTARSQAPSFNSAWLKNGESLTMVQRIGFTVISLANIAGGLFVLRIVLFMLKSGPRTATDLIFLAGGALVSVFFLILGCLGCRNVLRFG
jgi:hypothetical protein